MDRVPKLPSVVGSQMSERSAAWTGTSSISKVCTQQDNVLDPFDFRLPPIPSLGEFRVDKRANHPLLHYRRHIQKQKLEDAVIVQRGIKNKTRTHDLYLKRKKVEINSPEDAKLCHELLYRDKNEGEGLDEFLTQEDFVDYLRDSVLSAPVNPINAAWVRKIVSVRPQLHESSIDFSRMAMKSEMVGIFSVFPGYWRPSSGEAAGSAEAIDVGSWEQLRWNHEECHSQLCRQTTQGLYGSI